MLFTKPFHKSATIIEEGFIQFWMGPTVWIALDIVVRKTVLPAEGAFARGGYARQEYDGLLWNHETPSFQSSRPGLLYRKQSAFNDTSTKRRVPTGHSLSDAKLGADEPIGMLN